jgi:tetratricopeptide (TPR) repeat protein
VLKRNPRHFGALSGMGQIYFQLEDWGRALEWYRRALEVNPNMLGVEMNVRLLEEKLRDRPAPGRST